MRKLPRLSLLPSLVLRPSQLQHSIVSHRHVLFFFIYYLWYIWLLELLSYICYSKMNFGKVGVFNGIIHYHQNFWSKGPFRYHWPLSEVLTVVRFEVRDRLKEKRWIVKRFPHLKTHILPSSLSSSAVTSSALWSLRSLIRLSRLLTFWLVSVLSLSSPTRLPCSPFLQQSRNTWHYFVDLKTICW